MRKGLLYYLNKYYKIQDKIVVVYRPEHKSNWGDRCLFLDEDFNPTKPYNHRTILINEVVIEFDDKDANLNRKHAEIVETRLKRDGFKTSKWFSGNKSFHIHTFINVAEAQNVSLLKSVFMRHYADGLPNPDLKLTSANHLIRAEYGIHEKTGHAKRLLKEDKLYPMLRDVIHPVWAKYMREQTASMKQRFTKTINALDQHPLVKGLLDPETFRNVADDGRERLLFVFIHVLKDKYKQDGKGKKDLSAYLCEWYTYSGGRKLDDSDIYRKVSYHWNRSYDINEPYLARICQEVGIDLKSLWKESDSFIYK